MEVVYRLGEATVKQIADEMPERIGLSSVSKFLWLLEERGLLTHERRGRQNYYRPALAPEAASEGMLRNLMDTFFQGSASLTVSALLNSNRDSLSTEEVDDLFQLIKQFRKRGE